MVIRVVRGDADIYGGGSRVGLIQVDLAFEFVEPTAYLGNHHVADAELDKAILREAASGNF